MSVKLFDLSKQYQQIKEEIEPILCNHLATGAYIGGEAVAEFEKYFAEWMGVRYAISVNSGTDALIISLKAVGIKEGDEVITTPFTFFATAEAIASVGATPVFVDIEEDSMNINPKEIENKITNKTKAIIPVHIFGNPANMNEINRIANENNLIVIEDACQSIGAEYSGKKAGAIGDVGCFSFFPTKNLGAFGDAGMITTDSEKIAIACRAYKEHGMGENGAKAREILTHLKSEIKEMQIENELYNPYKYYNYLIAHNSRMDAIQAVILKIKMKYLNDFNEKRSKIAELYTKEFEKSKGIRTPVILPEVKMVWHQYAIRCKEKNELGKYLAEHEIGSAAFYPIPLHLQKAFTYLHYKEGDLPIAEKTCKETVCLPIYPELQHKEVQEVIMAIKDFYKD